jgi:amidohydrolase
MLVSPELERQAIAWRRHLHAHPELSFEEHETTRYIEQALAEIGGLEVERPTGSGVVARLYGARPGKTLALRADIDALPITEETGLEFTSTRPGAMHACGHDGHTAMLLAAAKVLVGRREELAGEVRFLFQPAEEAPPGGARAFVEAGVMDGVDLIVGAHLFSTVEVGKIAAPAGPLTAAADIWDAEVQGKGGHAAMPHQAVDPIVVASEVVLAFQQLVSRSVDPIKSAVVSVTRFEGGTAHNVIPEAVKLAGTVRTFDPEVRTTMRAGMERVLRGVTEAHGAGYSFEYVEGYDPVINDAEAAELVRAAAVSELGEDVLVEQPPIMGGEDFSAYLSRTPGVFFVVGAGEKGWTPHHHPRFTIDENAFRNGIAVFVRTALDYLGTGA